MARDPRRNVNDLRENRTLEHSHIELWHSTADGGVGPKIVTGRPPYVDSYIDSTHTEQGHVGGAHDRLHMLHVL